MKKLQVMDMLSIAGIAASLLVYAMLGGEKQTASPLALIIIAAIGWLVSFKWKPAGSFILFIAGAALMVHPLLFSSSLFYSLFSIPVSIAGISGIISWWNENNN